PPYHMKLEDVISQDDMKKITDSGKITFHVAGDTGGIKYPVPQQIVEMAMESDLAEPDKPVFFYHLGDVVYYFGQASEYYPQFYEPYAKYDAPIFAIPGNHDGDVPPGDTTPSLDAFVRNFCAKKRLVVPDSIEVNKSTMVQPNVYFTLEIPFATIVGLYSNVPEGGQFDDTQIAWFKDELRNAPKNKALIVTVHHPAYSADMYHTGSKVIDDTLDNAFSESGRYADMVLAGHVHNYQRFTRRIDNMDIPYIVAGAGGYWHLHYMQKQPNGDPLSVPYTMPENNTTLESYCENRHGYLLMQITLNSISGTYHTVPRPQESWRDKSKLFDSFTLDLCTHEMKK
ncbi:MAG: metallophosphoesterase family protein, partial [Nitrosotalea sp.]